MNTRVVSISRQVGSAGEEVAAAVAARLGYRMVDYQVIQQAAREAGVSPEMVSESEHTPSLSTRILEALARTPAVPVAGWADPTPLSSSPLYNSLDYRHVVEDVIRDVADHGNCVIVGHAAQVILRERFDTLRVLVTGSPKQRSHRIMAGMGVDEKTAIKTVERTDDERRDYFRRFYDTPWLAPWTYDLTLNTDNMKTDAAAELIVRAAALH